MSPPLSRALKEKMRQSVSGDERPRQTNSQKQRPHCVRETARRPVWLLQRVGESLLGGLVRWVVSLCS